MPYTKYLLSGSTDGLAISVHAVASLGTNIHTAIAGTSSLDEVTLFATNTTTALRKLTLEWGGTSVSQLVIQYIPGQVGDFFITAGRLIRNALSITAFSDAADAVSIHGYVNRIT
jgi:hypothetical protein